MQQNTRLPVEILVSMYNLIEVLMMKGAHPETGVTELLVAILPRVSLLKQGQILSRDPLRMAWGPRGERERWLATHCSS